MVFGRGQSPCHGQGRTRKVGPNHPSKPAYAGVLGRARKPQLGKCTFGKEKKMSKDEKFVVMQDIDSNVHVIPISFFENVANGTMEFLSLEKGERILPVVIQQWIKMLKIHSNNTIPKIV